MGRAEWGPERDTEAQPGDCAQRRVTERRQPTHARFKNSGESDRLIFRELEKHRFSVW